MEIQAMPKTSQEIEWDIRYMDQRLVDGFHCWDWVVSSGGGNL